MACMGCTKRATQRACAPACRRLNNKISARRTRERRNFQLRKLEEENDVLGKQILMLQQQVTELRSANHVLLQNLPQISDHQRCHNSLGTLCMTSSAALWVLPDLSTAAQAS